MKKSANGANANLSDFSVHLPCIQFGSESNLEKMMQIYDFLANYFKNAEKRKIGSLVRC